jgi:hypothetical protein
MKKVIQVKSKGLLLWIIIFVMSIDDPSSGKIYFKGVVGIRKSFLANAFETKEND